MFQSKHTQGARFSLGRGRTTTRLSVSKDYLFMFHNDHLLQVIFCLDLRTNTGRPLLLVASFFVQSPINCYVLVIANLKAAQVSLWTSTVSTQEFTFFFFGIAVLLLSLSVWLSVMYLICWMFRTWDWYLWWCFCCISVGMCWIRWVLVDFLEIGSFEPMVLFLVIASIMVVGDDGVASCSCFLVILLVYGSLSFISSCCGDLMTLLLIQSIVCGMSSAMFSKQEMPFLGSTNMPHCAIRGWNFSFNLSSYQTPWEISF